MHMNTGPCTNIGSMDVQPPIGFASLSSYSFMISRCMASLLAGSFLPLYLFWMRCILGCKTAIWACILRMPFMDL